jgi:NADH-quinone oxidoreductase subunit E
MEPSKVRTIENQFPEIKTICDHYRGNAGALLLVLQQIQDAYGYIPKVSLNYIAKSLMVTPSHLYGTMTFYNRFTLTPKRKYTIKVCRGTACELNGAPALLIKLGELLIVNREGEIEHPLFSLEQSACLGECDKALVMVINDTLYAKATPEQLEEAVKEILSKETQAELSKTSRS